MKPFVWNGDNGLQNKVRICAPIHQKGITPRLHRLANLRTWSFFFGLRPLYAEIRAVKIFGRVGWSGGP